SEEHTSELQSLTNLVCRLLLEKKKNIKHERDSIRIEFPSVSFKDPRTRSVAGQNGVRVPRPYAGLSTCRAAAQRTHPHAPLSAYGAAAARAHCPSPSLDAAALAHARSRPHAARCDPRRRPLLRISHRPCPRRPSRPIVSFFFLNAPPPPDFSLFPLHAPFPI